MSRLSDGRRNSEIDLGGLAHVISVRRPMVELPAIAKTFSL